MAYMNMDEHGYELGPSCPCEQAGKYVPSCDAHSVGDKWFLMTDEKPKPWPKLDVQTEGWVMSVADGDISDDELE